MKLSILFALVFSIFFFSCGNSATEQQVQPNVSSSSLGQNDTGTSNAPALNRSDLNLEPIRGKGPAEIKITMQNAQPMLYYLVGTYTDQVFRVDSARLNNQGQIVFKNAEGYPQGLYYVTLPNDSHIQLMLGENQKINISFNPNNITNTLKSDDMENALFFETSKKEGELAGKFNMVNAKIQSAQQGSEAYSAARKEQEALVAERKQIMQDLFDKNPNSLFAKFKKAGQNPEIRTDLDEQAQIVQYRKDFWMDVDFSDRRLLRTPVVSNKVKRYFSELTPQIPDSIVSSAIWLIDRSLAYPEYFKYLANWVPLNYEPTKTTLMDPEMVYTRVIQRYFTFDKAFWADSTLVYGLQRRANEMSGSLLGLKGPDVVANDPDGNEQSIASLKQDYVIVYMFSPDCEHCREETPKLIEWYKKKKPYSVEVFGIGVKTEDQQWRDYVKSSRMPWINVFDPTNRAIYGKYFVDITPEMYVLNPQRKIIAKNIKTHQIDTVINRDREVAE